VRMEIPDWSRKKSPELEGRGFLFLYFHYRWLGGVSRHLVSLFVG
jgi:hypothetical protein